MTCEGSMTCTHTDIHLHLVIIHHLSSHSLVKIGFNQPQITTEYFLLTIHFIDMSLEQNIKNVAKLNSKSNILPKNQILSNLLIICISNKDPFRMNQINLDIFCLHKSIVAAQLLGNGS